jgi:4-hydroxybenzoate polyprenyltransferase
VSTTPQPTESTVVRLLRFTWDRFRPPVYVTYGVLWVLSLEGSAVVLSGGGQRWVPSWSTVLCAVTVVSVLLFMRMLDEQKDLAHDRIHHPNRPLVSGAVSAWELRWAMAVIAVLVTVVNLITSPAASLVLLIDLGYGLGLALAERRMRAGPLLELTLAYPIQVLLSGYLCVSVVVSGLVRPGWWIIVVLLLHAGVFLHFEFARKTSRDGAPDARLYSRQLGVLGSASAALGCAVVAGIVCLLAFRPWELSGAVAVVAWIPVLALVFPLYGAWRFLVGLERNWPLSQPMCFVLVVHFALAAQAILDTGGNGS